MLASIWWIKWPQLAGFQGRTCWENTGAARNASFTMAISMCLGRVLVSLWASGLLGHPSSFFRDAFSCNTAAPLFLPHKNSAKNMCMLTFTQQLGTWSWNTTWEIQVFFRVPCETLQEILEYASGGRQGSPRGISQGLTLTHGLLLLRVGCNLKVGHFDTKKHTPQVVNPRISRYFCKIVGMIFFWAKVQGSGISGDITPVWRSQEIPSMPPILTRLFDAILDAECHTEQETANFLHLGMGNGLAGWCWVYTVYPHGLVDGHGHGCWDYLQYPPSLFPQNHQALVRLQLLSAVQHMHERLPFLSGEDWEGMARWVQGWLTRKRPFFPERNLKREPDLYIIILLIFFLMIN